MVRTGPVGRPAVVVLDPAGEAKHGGLPATWRSLAEDVEVIWWRLPTMVRDGRDAASMIAELALDRRLYLVGAGDAVLLTLSLAKRYRAGVGSVVLVDPPGPAEDDTSVRFLVDDPDFDVRQVRTGPDNVLPIGHPDVVRAVVEALLSAGLWPSHASAGTVRLPAAESLMSQAWDAVRVRLGELLGVLSGR